MKFKIWEEREHQNYYLQLVELSGGIYLRAVRNNGDVVSCILRINDGEIARCDAVDSCLGFPLDSRGRVILKK